METLIKHETDTFLLLLLVFQPKEFVLFWVRTTFVTKIKLPTLKSLLAYSTANYQTQWSELIPNDPQMNIFM